MWPRFKRGYQEPATSILRHNGHPAWAWGISIVPGGNVIELGDAVKAKLKELEGMTPVGMELNVINFQADMVKEGVDGFLINLAEAVAIVILVLMIFMGIRSGLIIGAGLVITIAATFLVMDMQDINLQRISLGALVLALGMLVDNAIVVTEGMLVKTSQGMDSEDAAAQTVQPDRLALLAGATAVAVLAFAALGLSNNSAGEFCASLFSVMFISLGLSWVLAITVTPLMCHMFLKKQQPEKDFDPYGGLLFRIYRPFFLQLFAPPHPDGAGHGDHAGRIASTDSALLTRAFFPSSTRPGFLVNYWLPQGTHIDRTSEDLKNWRNSSKTLPGVKGVTTFVGQGSLRYTLAGETEFTNPAYGQLKVEVEDYKQVDGLLPKVSAYAGKTCPTPNAPL
jgi:multidrug efflux pump subunit AcrB